MHFYDVMNLKNIKCCKNSSFVECMKFSCIVQNEYVNQLFMFKIDQQYCIYTSLTFCVY